MNKFIPKLFKIYKYYSSDGKTYRFYYKFDPSINIWYYLSINIKQLYITNSTEFDKFLSLRGAKHANGRLNSEQTHEVLLYVFTYLEV